MNQFTSKQNIILYTKKAMSCFGKRVDYEKVYQAVEQLLTHLDYPNELYFDTEKFIWEVSNILGEAILGECVIGDV